MIYIISEDGSDFVKIGFSSNIKKRITKMKSDNPRELTLLKLYNGDRNIEKWIHSLFLENHIHGDWFIFDKEMLNIDLNNYNNKPIKLPSKNKEKVKKEILNIIEIGGFVKADYQKVKYNFPKNYKNIFKEIKRYNESMFGTNTINTLARIDNVSKMLKNGDKIEYIAAENNITRNTVLNIKNKYNNRLKNKFKFDKKVFDKA